MKIQIELKRSEALVGVDFNSLESDIAAEILKLEAELSGTETKRTQEAPPEGAQGEFEIINWLVTAAQEPEAIKMYIRGFIMALNSIAAGYLNRDNEKDDDSEDQSEDQENTPKPKKTSYFSNS